MGYIFDALNRNPRQGPAQQDPGQSLVEPAGPAGAATGAPRASEQAATAVAPGTPGASSDADTPMAASTSQQSQAGLRLAAAPEESAPLAHTPTVSVSQDRQSRCLDTSHVDERLVMIADPCSVVAEEYRAIRTGILARWQQRRHLVHTLTSATPQEGKTITSLNLALCFAELRNRKTLVIEADLRLPQFSNMLQQSVPWGLAELLSGQAKLNEVLFRVGETGPDVIFAGSCRDEEAVRLISSPHTVGLIRQLREAYDHVIIDTPPVVELADAGILGAASDDVVLIARMNRTPRPLIAQAIRTLATYNAPVAGMIGTEQTRSHCDYYSKNGYHSYSYYGKRYGSRKRKKAA